MDLRRYVRIFRRRWRLILVSVLVCAGAAAAIAATKPPTYAAHIQMFVSANAPSGSLGDTYEGGLFIQQRMPSYTSFVTSAAVTQRVITRLRLSDSVQQLQSAISASTPTGTVLINATVTDRTPRRAQAIADALGAEFSAYVSSLEAPQASGQPSVKVTSISPASLPTAPVSPRKSLDVSLGVLLGLVVGTIAAVVLEALDDRIREEEDVAPIARAQVIGSIGDYPHADLQPLIVSDAPGSPAAEAFRRLRTNLSVVARDLDPPVFLVSSAMPSDGKTFVAANLGVVYAQAGHRVVMVDADLRRPTLGRVLGVSPTRRGLSSILAKDRSLDTQLYARFKFPLELLDSGPLPPHPGELLESPRFAELMTVLGSRARADIVIVDAPALLVAADAAIVAKSVSGIIMVARAGRTRAAEIRSAMHSLQLIKTPVIGVVLNCVPPRDARPYGPFRDRGAPPRRADARAQPLKADLDVDRAPAEALADGPGGARRARTRRSSRG